MAQEGGQPIFHFHFNGRPASVVADGMDLSSSKSGQPSISRSRRRSPSQQWRPLIPKSPAPEYRRTRGRSRSQKRRSPSRRQDRRSTDQRKSTDQGRRTEKPRRSKSRSRQHRRTGSTKSKTEKKKKKKEGRKEKDSSSGKKPTRKLRPCSEEANTKRKKSPIKRSKSPSPCPMEDAIKRSKSPSPSLLKTREERQGSQPEPKKSDRVEGHLVKAVGPTTRKQQDRQSVSPTSPRRSRSKNSQAPAKQARSESTCTVMVQGKETIHVRHPPPHVLPPSEPPLPPPQQQPPPLAEQPTPQQPEKSIKAGNMPKVIPAKFIATAKQSYCPAPAKQPAQQPKLRDRINEIVKGYQKKEDIQKAEATAKAKQRPHMQPVPTKPPYPSYPKVPTFWPPAPPPAKRTNRKLEDTDYDEEQWGDWTCNMADMPMGTKPSTSSSSRMQNNDKVVPKTPQRPAGVWGTSVRIEESPQREVPSTPSSWNTPADRANYVKEEIELLKSWESSCGEEHIWPNSEIVHKVRLHLTGLLKSHEIIEEKVFANLCMHIAASNLDLKKLTKPITKMSTEHAHYWKLSINDMSGPTMSHSQGMYDYCWVHATSSAGILGSIKLGKMLKSFSEGNTSAEETFGFYSMCTSLENKEWNEITTLNKAWALNKNSSRILIGGTATHIKPATRSKGVEDEQRACGVNGITHGSGRWCIRPSLSKIEALWIRQEIPQKLAPEM